MNFQKIVKGNKYKNRKIKNDFGTWDSKKELERFLFLKEAQENGLICDLKIKPKFELIPSIKETEIKHLKTKDKEVERTVQLAITYTADFSYYKDGVYVVEDVKASPKFASLDKAFLIKEKLFRWKFGYGIKRVYKPNEEI